MIFKILARHAFCFLIEGVKANLTMTIIVLAFVGVLPGLVAFQNQASSREGRLSVKRRANQIEYFRLDSGASGSCTKNVVKNSTVDLSDPESATFHPPLSCFDL